MEVEGNTVKVENIDVLDGTPLLDIKPYVPEFDHQEVQKTGWLDKTAKRVAKKRSDERFG
ncbi:MAG: TrmO family methyltransferase domain-containing protein [Thermoplasmatota archaeon]